MNSDRAANYLIVLLLLVVLAAVGYSIVLNARVATALQGVDRNLQGGRDAIDRFRSWLGV